MFPTFDFTSNEECLKLIEEITTDAKQIQETVLEKILSENANTEYLKKRLNGESNKQSFKRNVAVVSYEDVRPYIERIANGEPSDIICSQPIVEFVTSSGTSGGAPKLMPLTAQEMYRRLIFWCLIKPAINKHVEGLDQGKFMYFAFIEPEIKTPSGLVGRSALTGMCKSSSFRNQVKAGHTAISNIVLCEDTKQSRYCQLLCGLVQRDDVVSIGSTFGSNVLKTIKFLEDYWREMCSNIRTGRVSDWIIDSGCKKDVYSVLTSPNSELADLIESQCSKTCWEGIVRKLWPRVKHINAIVTGSMAQYVPQLEFYAGDLPLISTYYASSESFFGINLDPLSGPSEVSYTFIPNMAYFEFLLVAKSRDCETDDEHCIRKDDQPVDLSDVKIGHSYEVIVTTFTGLYRFRVGDIVMVTGFYNNAPQFRFVRRQNTLSIDTEKTNEEDVFKAVTNTKPRLEELGLMLIDYTCYADLSSFPGHYVLFWEFKTKNDDQTTNLDPDTFQECCLMVEESLDYEYRRCRMMDKTIGPLEIRVVKQGTFDELMHFFVSRGASFGQYKMPRFIRSEEALKTLDSGVVGSFFSQKDPSWEPYSITKAEESNEN